MIFLDPVSNTHTEKKSIIIEKTPVTAEPPESHCLYESIDAR